MANRAAASFAGMAFQTVFMGWLLAVLHPFYVSMTEVDYNAKDKTVEVSVRIFTDDLEETLRLNHPGKKIDVLKPVDAAEMQQWLHAYVQQHLQLQANGQPLVLQWVGHEQQAESVWIYLETKPGIAAIQSLQVANTLLYDFKKEQINLVRAKVAGAEKNYRLSFPEKRVDFRF